jgi:hypothetical protein
MRILASPEAVDHIMSCGGRLFVWVQPSLSRCGPAFLEAATEKPTRLRRSVPKTFDRVDGAEFELYLAHGSLAVPDELQIELTRRHRIRAYWNGYAYVGLG